ncbi:MAG: enoyl-CoA hydratase/isomerase family protein [Halioglobus sp.]|nr:enoyl-CoA hydratase/isomerase family protein [Halioglobus sp.]
MLLDVDDCRHGLSRAQHQSACAALAQLPCPVIGLRRAAAEAPAVVPLSSLDVVVDSPQAARPLLENIRRAPLAAMTLVQLLRHNESANMQQGLFAESVAYAALQGGREFSDFLATGAPAAGETTAAPATAATQAVLAERRQDELWLTLNRPERRNAYSMAMRDQLIEGLQLLASDATITRCIIRGAGACFCVGGDLDEFGLFDNTAEAHAIRSTRNAGLLIAELAARIECRVHRACIGSGLELPAFCHRVVATGNTLFQLPEITMGLIPGAGGTVSVLRRIGRQRTAWLTLSARRINAAQALEWGLIDEIVESTPQQ